MLPRLIQPVLRPVVRSLMERGLGSRASLNSYGPTNPLYMAHRGGSLVAPEDTLEAFRQALASGIRAIELDVQLSSDSALVVMHDATVDRTTTSSGNVSSISAAQWATLQIDAESQNIPGFGNAVTPPTFAQVLAEFKGRAILVPEAKNSTIGPPLTAALQSAGIAADQALVQSFALAGLTDAIAAGYAGLYLVGTSSTDIALAQAAGVSWVGVSAAAADSVVQDWINAGFKVAMYTVNRRWQRDYYLALGVSGFFSDDPVYLAGSSPTATADNYAAQRWQSGMFPNFESILPQDRGVFSAPDKWGYPLDGAAFDSCLQGWACPIKGNPNADSYTIDFKVVFGSANAGDGTRWASVFLCASDRPFVDGSPAPRADQQGFHFLMRKNGAILIYTITTAAITNRTSTGTAAIADGEEARYRITISPTDVSISRLDGVGNVMYSSSYSDSTATLRGGYLHFSRAGLGCDFRDVSVS